MIENKMNKKNIIRYPLVNQVEKNNRRVET
jgi:hypothetical protein